MTQSRLTRSSALRLTPLATCLALACGWSLPAIATEASSSVSAMPFGTPPGRPGSFWAPRYVAGQSSSKKLPPPTGAATTVVKNCNDSGTGSLRTAVANAASGDVIDLSQLSCSTITLTSGAIAISQDSLELDGPGADKLAIDGGYSAGHVHHAFAHSGTGYLNIFGVTVTDAKYVSSSFAQGGCISSLGSVYLASSTVTGCFAQSHGGYLAFGAGIFAAKGVTLFNSIVTANITNPISTIDSAGAGAGVYTEGYLRAYYSTISNNLSSGAVANYRTESGGVGVFNGDVMIFSSTISGNSARYTGYAGGLLVRDTTGTHVTQIINSTISGNYAGHFYGGAEIQSSLYLANSTIAFNTAGTVDGLGAGLDIYNNKSQSVMLYSSIIALNSAGGVDSDINSYQGSTVTGANNLITTFSGTVPPDTITACPLLGPLADNGGTHKTLTHRPLINSPALDAGSNFLALKFDERGTGHPRTFGVATDIGAFESAGDIPNEIFSSEFESRCR